MSFDKAIIVAFLGFIISCESVVLTYPFKFNLVPIGSDEQNDNYGEVVSIMGNTSMIAAPGDRRDTFGSVYIYDRDMGTWSLNSILVNPKNWSAGLTPLQYNIISLNK
jgi:hypothetical protein